MKSRKRLSALVLLLSVISIRNLIASFQSKVLELMHVGLLL